MAVAVDAATGHPRSRGEVDGRDGVGQTRSGTVPRLGSDAVGDSPWDSPPSRAGIDVYAYFKHEHEPLAPGYAAALRAFLAEGRAVEALARLERTWSRRRRSRP